MRDSCGERTVLHLDYVDIGIGCDIDLEFCKILPLGETG